MHVSGERTGASAGRAGALGEEVNDTNLSRLIERNRRFLSKRGLLSQPWLVFGAAPDPTIPEQPRNAFIRVDINNAGRTAQQMGLGRAGLTIRNQNKTWSEHPEIDTDCVLFLVKGRFVGFPRRFAFRKPYRHIGSCLGFAREDREAVIRKASGVLPGEVGEMGRVSNGIFATCYGLLLDVPNIVLAGISLSKTGHSYDQQGRRRYHVEEDRYILQHLIGTGRVSTSEPDLANDTGLPLLKNS